MLVLSLGTGQHTVGYDARDVAKWGLVDWLANKGEAPLVDMVFNASADMVDYNLSIIFQSQQCPANYLRIQVHLKDLMCGEHHNLSIAETLTLAVVSHET